MTDLVQQIRERLEGWAPAAHGEAPPAFAEVTAPESWSQEQVEELRRRWKEFVGGAPRPLIRLPSTPRFYPGFEQMRAALLAVLAMHPADQPHACTRRSGDYFQIVTHLPGSVCDEQRAFADALGVEVADDAL